MKFGLCSNNIKFFRAKMNKYLPFFSSLARGSILLWFPRTRAMASLSFTLLLTAFIMDRLKRESANFALCSRAPNGDSRRKAPFKWRAPTA